MRKYLFLVILFIIFSRLLFGAGFWVPEFPSGAASGMSMAFTGQADDLGALYFNPAGITQLEGLNVSLVNTLILFSVEYENYYNPGRNKADGPAYVPYVAMSHDFGLENITFGMAIYSIFGLNFVYDESGPQRYLIQEVDLMAPTINPTMAIKVNDSLSVALGLKLSRISIELNKAIDTGHGIREYDIDTSLTGSDYGYGFDISFLYSLSENLRIGMVYDSRMKFSTDNVELDVNYPQTAEWDKTISGETTLILPASLRFGVYYRPIDKLAFNFDINWMNWKSWDEIKIDIDEPIVPGTPQQIILKRYWDNSFAYRLGAEYYYTDELTFRAGIAYDEKAASDEWLEPGVPDTNKINISLGMGYKFQNFTIDFAFLYFFAEKREIRNSQQMPPADGDYTSDFTFFCLGINYRF